MQQVFKDIDCPLCNRGKLCRISEDTNGKIEGKCGCCRTIAIYDTKTKKYTIIKSKKVE